MNDGTDSQTPSAVRLLIEWANEQEGWVRVLVGEVLSTREAPTDAALDGVFAHLLAEKGLCDDVAPAVGNLEWETAPEEAGVGLQLLRLGELSGVNALAVDQEINFNPRMTVLFGENAAGKTGYVRVLKALGAVRGAERVLPNINGQAQRLAATVAYRLDGDEYELTWDGTPGVPPFTRMSAFDSRAVNLHLEDGLTYVFTPGELALFKHVHSSIENLKARLESTAQERCPAGNPFLARLPRGTRAYTEISVLGAATELSAVEALAAVSPVEQASLEALRGRVEALRPEVLQSSIKASENLLGLLSALLDATATIAAFDPAGWTEAAEDAERAEEAYRRSRHQSFAFPGRDGQHDTVEEVLSPAWHSFVTAAENYRGDLLADDYPIAGEPCLYCHQPLVGAAVELVRRYREYTSGDVQQMAMGAVQKRDRLAAPLLAVDTESLLGRLNRDRDSSAVFDLATELLTATADLQDRLRTGVHPALPAPPSRNATAILEALTMRHSQAVETHGQLTARAGERSAALKNETQNLHDLEARLSLREMLAQVRTHVLDAKWAHKAREQAGRLPGIARSLTAVSKRASEDLLNADFEARFEAERLALRAPVVKLEFPGRRGEATRRKSVAPGHGLAEILSEGEQKVIALADFLAEAALHQAGAPLIFDDPVNSLDYKRLQHVVTRLVKLSETHQVVVFTHNIWFATELLARFDKDKTGCNYVLVCCDGPVKGLVRSGTGPRSDGIKATAGKINKLIQDASTLTGETRAALVEKAYEYMRNWCEVVVEQELLAKVTQRYQPNVAMTQLANIKSDRLDSAIGAILPAYEKACRIIAAHSQPLETLNVRPELEELQEDWAALLSARTAYLAS